MTKINFGKGFGSSETYVWIDSEFGATSEIDFAARYHSSKLEVRHRDGGPRAADAKPLTLLFIGANSDDLTRLNLEEELRAIHLSISRSPARHSIRIVAVLAARPDDLLGSLNHYRPDILHFAGHGSSGRVFFTNDSGTSLPISAETLAAVLSGTGSLSLIVANSCVSSSLKSMLSPHARCMITMRSEISDEAAIAFAEAFYSALSEGRTVTQAHKQGVASLLVKGIDEAHVPDCHLDPECQGDVYRLVDAAGQPIVMC